MSRGLEPGPKAAQEALLTRDNTGHTPRRRVWTPDLSAASESLELFVLAVRRAPNGQKTVSRLIIAACYIGNFYEAPDMSSCIPHTNKYLLKKMYA